MKATIALAALLLVAGTAPLRAAETLHLKLDQPQHFTAGSRTVKIDGCAGPPTFVV